MVLAVRRHELPVLLVGQGLERRRVEGFAPLGEGASDRVLGDQRLARSGGGRDEYRPPGVERVEAWQQNNRANHFTLMEVCKDPAALEGHVVTPSTREFREKLGPLSGALFDDRRYTSIE